MEWLRPRFYEELDDGVLMGWRTTCHVRVAVDVEKTSSVISTSIYFLSTCLHLLNYMLLQVSLLSARYNGRIELIILLPSI